MLYIQEFEFSEEPEAGIARTLEPVHLYVFAEKYDVLKLKDDICRLLYDGRTTQGRDVAKDAVSYAYENPS